MEKNIEQLRRHNEKMAKAIRRVKDNPELVDQVKQMEQYTNLESQVKSKELQQLKEQIGEEKRKREEQLVESNELDQELQAIQQEYSQLEKLL